jgi:TolB-like protein/Tfp pilus assembly protein PilF
VVTIHGADVFDGRAGIWMEFVAGRTLKAIVAEQGPFGPSEAAVIGRDLCRALAAVHHRGFVHRDVKAQNVMREAGGRTVLMDFGAGEAATPAGGPAGESSVVLRGSPAYLAPEVLAGGPPTVQSDLYGLGVLLYFLVSGDYPVVAANLAELRERHEKNVRRRLRDVRPDLPEAFIQVVDAATAPDPAARPQTAGAMEALLEGALGISDGARQVVGKTGETRPSNPMRRVFTRGRLLAIAALLAVATAVGWSRWPPLARPQAPIVPRSSVAVLPFKGITPGGGDDYFSDGITQDVVAHLAALRDLRVIAGASTLAYRNRGKTAVEIGRELGVATVLDGSVRREGERVRIVSRLVDAVTDEQLWTATFERDLKEVLAMQTEVAYTIAVALRGELSAGEADLINAPRARDFEAFNLYLKGRHAATLRTQDGLTRSVQFHQAAIARDPKYALAYAGLSDAYTSLGTYGFLPRAEAYARAAAAATQAVAHDDTLAEAHVSLAYAHKNRFEWAEAERSFTRAIQLKPGLAQAHHWYSIFLTQHGRFPEAITEIRAALSLDPLSLGANQQLATVLLMARRHEDAISQWQRALRMNTELLNAYRGMTSAYTYLGLYDHALGAAAEATRRTPLGAEDQELKADLGYVLAVSGRRAEALRIVRALTDRYDATGEELAGSIAALHAGLGAIDPAFEWLHRAYERRDPELGFLKVDPRWDPLRRDKRFQALLKKLGFVH